MISSSHPVSVRLPSAGRVVAGLVVLLAFGLAALHAWSVQRYLARVSEISFQAEPAGEAARPITLGIAADGQTWLRLTEERMEEGGWRLPRRTEIDHTPQGREVHWSSLWSLWLEAGGRVRAAFTGEAPAVALAGAAGWMQLPLWAAVLVLGAWGAFRLWGAGAAAALALLAVGHRGFVIALYPGYPDHHGVVAALVLGLVLGVVAGTRRGALASALCGAFGLALSASSVAVPVALTGAAAGLWALAAARSCPPDTARRLASLCLLWGRTGAAVALGLYLLEYAPADFAWRLEVNHPAHALAWWGGAELVAWLILRRAGVAGAAPGWRAGAALAGVAAPLAVLAVFGAAAFAPLDAFLAGVHRHIDEFKPLWTLPPAVRWLFGLALVLPLAALPWAWRAAEEADRARLAGLALLTLGLSALALWQQRWWSVAAPAQILLATATTGLLWRAGGARRVVWVLALVALIVPGSWQLARERLRVERAADVQSGEAMQLISRDIAAVLRAQAGEGEVRLLAAPNATVGAGYYGRFAGTGTLYWENGDGLRTAAGIFTALDDEAAARAVRELGITHVAMVSPGDFTAEYADALGLGAEKVDAMFGRRAFAGRGTPAWLRAIPYRVPPEFAGMRVAVSLYAVDWTVPEADSRWALAVARLIAGDEAGGRAALLAASEAGRPEAGLVLAWRMATAKDAAWRDPEAAVERAEAAIAVLPEAAGNRRVLAAAYAAAGRWPDAQATALFALDQALEAGDARLAREIETEFARYRERRALAE
jgi:hypothetical protein